MRFDDLAVLGLRATHAKAFRWMPGMLVRHGTSWSLRITDDWVSPGVVDAWPDLTDPATLGCLLALVREQWHDVQSYRTGEREWTCRCYDGMYWHTFVRLTEADALVDALDAAPEADDE